VEPAVPRQGTAMTPLLTVEATMEILRTTVPVHP
jgi:hypothetical protein